MPAHLAELTIDLKAVTSNRHFLLHNQLSEKVLCSAVLKANAYGLGARQVGQALFDDGCTTFFVAHLDEALELRTALPDAQIYVLHGLLPETEDLFMQHALIPVLNSMEDIAQWRAWCRHIQQPLSCAIHLDTGMSRLGLNNDDVTNLADDAFLLEGLDLKLVMSHLASAEEQGNPQNRQQLERFNTMRHRLPKTLYSLANSSGIFLGNDFHFDVVRPGAALYGINPVVGKANPLQQAVTLTAKILQVREIPPGTTVGYNATFHAKRPTRLAIIGCGYADGYLRSSKGHVLIGEHKAPITGRVSMDLMTVDVTDIPENLAAPGHDAMLFGPGVDIDLVGDNAGSCAYELLTRLGSRFNKKYVGQQEDALRQAS